MRACATIAPGLEPVVHHEAARLGIDPVDDPLDNAGFTAFEADGPAQLVDALGRMRTLHRVGPVLAAGRVDPEDPWTGLAELVASIDAARWFGEGPFAVRGHRSGDHPFTSVDVAAHVGDVLHDHLEAQLGARPAVDLDDPDAILRVHLDDAGRARLWLDLAGPASLHRRGYRVYDHPAGMKASLASALLELAGWPHPGAFADPMAGGGTLVVEAAWKALNVPPVQLRADDLLAWNAPELAALRDKLPNRKPDGAPDRRGPFVLGDHAPNHVEGARRNLDKAGVGHAVETYAGDVAQLPEHVDQAVLVASNPPYGLRSGEEPLGEVYRTWVDAGLQVTADEGRLGLMTPATDLVEAIADERGLTVAERVDVQHGRLEIGLVVLER